jgi:hypothetical protein
LFNRESSFEEAARSFVPQVMKMKVVYAQVTAPSPEGGADWPVIEWEDSIIVVAAHCLLLNDGPRVVAGRCEQRYALIVDALVARVFPVTDEKHPRASIQIGTTCLADFLPAHRGCDGETYDLANWRHLTRIWIEVSDQSVELILGRPPVTLISFPNEAEPL